MEGTSRSTHAAALLRDFPKTPSGFVRIPEKLLIDCNRIFDNYIFCESLGNGVKSYVCTSCYAHWHTPERTENWKVREIAQRHHNDVAHCPHCGDQVQIKSIGKSRTRRSLDQTRHMLFLWAASESLVFGAAAYVFKNYSDEYETLQLDYSIDALYTFEPGESHSWKTQYDYKAGCHGRLFNETRTTAVPFAANIANWYVSPVGLTDAVENSFLRYCAYDKGVLHYNHAKCDFSYCDYIPDEEYAGESIVLWLADYCRYPKIEMLAKLGFTGIINDTVMNKRRYPKLLNWRASTPHGFFRMSKRDFAALAKYGQAVHTYNLAELREMRKLDETVSINDYWRYKSQYSIDTLIGAATRADVGFAKLTRYLDGASMTRMIYTSTTKAQTYRDYLDMAEAIGFDLAQNAVKFPKNLDEAHDRATAAYNAIKIERQKHEGEALHAELQARFAYEDDDFFIRAPYCAAEIVAEGQAIHHCVAGYADRHCKGKTVILLLREKSAPNVPYFTVEMDPVGGVHMKQIHGLRNKDPDTPELVAFVKAYKQHLAGRQQKVYEAKNKTADIDAAV